MALVPVIQPPIMRLLTSREERLIRMKPPRKVSKREKMIFPIAAFLICTLIAPGALVLIGMLFFGNLLKESTVTDRLANTARSAMIDIVKAAKEDGVEYKEAPYKMPVRRLDDVKAARQLDLAYRPESG